MPVPDPFPLADPFTGESSKDAGSSSSDDEDDGAEVVAAVVRANDPTEGITFNGSIYYQKESNPSLGRGRALLWQRPPIVPREASPVEIIYKKEQRKRTSHSPVRKSSSATTSGNQGGGGSSDSGESSHKVNSSTTGRSETMWPPSTQSKPIPKAMSKATSTTSGPRKPPSQVQDEQSRRPYPFAPKHMLGPARKSVSSSAPTRTQEGGHMPSASQGQSSKTMGGSIFKAPSQTAPGAAISQQPARYPQSQPQSRNPSSSSSSQAPFRTASQTAYSQIRGQRSSAPQHPVSSSVFKPPQQHPRQPSSQEPPGHVHRDTRIRPPNAGNSVLNDPTRASYQFAPQPTSSQVNDPQSRTQQPYPTNNVSRPPAQPLFRGAVQPPRSGLLLSQPTPSRLSPSQPSGPDIPQPLATAILPPRPQPQPHMLTSEFTSQHPVSTSAASISSDVGFHPAIQPPEAPNLTVQDIESKLETFASTVGEDHARYVEYLLDEAEQMAPEPKHLSNFDAFADMPALSATTSDVASVSEAGVETMAFKLKLHHGDNGRPRAPTKAFKCPVVKIKTDKEAVPKYRFHHTEIKKNMLVPNAMLTFVPHLRDVDPDSPAEKQYINWLNELNKLDSDSGFKTESREQKQNKRIRDEYTATLSMYIEPWLKQLGLDVVCPRSTLIRYMLSQEENQAHITQQQKDAFLNTYKDDAELLPKAVEAARMFTLAFNNVFGNNTEPERSITLREVLLLEKRETVVDEKRAKETPPPADAERDQSDSNGLLPKVEASLSSYTVLGCNICFSHDCEHGDIDKFNYHRTFSLDSVGGVIRALKRKWADQVASMGGDDAAAAATSKKAMHLPCHNACYRHYDVGPAVAPVTPWEDSEVSVLEDMFLSVGHSQTLKAQCVVATILGRKCWEVYRKIKELDLTLPHVSPPRPKTGPKGGPPAKVKPLPWYDRRKKCLMGDWQEQTSTHEASQREITEPCHHDGPCTKENKACGCANASPLPLLCDRFCHCTAEDCALKFTGCACHSSGKTCIQKQKEGKPCICLMLNRECDPIVCKGCGAKERADPDNAYDEVLHSTGCQNVSLQRGATKTLLLGKSQLEGCGYGLYTAEDIAQDEYVIEYTGEMISHDEGVRREARRGEGFGPKGSSSYLFTLMEYEGIWVDAAMYGNESRYINHASESDKRACNIGPKIVYVNYEYRIKFNALRDIKAGEELFFNYGDNFPNLTKKLLQDQESDGNGATRKGKGRGGKRGVIRPTANSSNLAAQGTARKATSKASTTSKGKAKRGGTRRTAATMEVPPSDDDEDETWIKYPVPLYEEQDDEDDEDYDSSGGRRRRRRRGGRRPGAGRKRGGKRMGAEESGAEAEADAEGGEGGEDGDGDDDVPMANTDADADADTTSGQRPMTRTRRARAVSEISDSQVEREEDENEDENHDANQDKSEDSDAPLSPSRVTGRRRRQLRNTTNTSNTTTSNAATAAIANNTRARSAPAPASTSASAYTTATSTPVPSQPGDGGGDNGDGEGDGEGDGNDEGDGNGEGDAEGDVEGDDEGEGNQEQDQDQDQEEGQQEKKRSNRGGARPGAGRKPRNMLRHANSGSTSASGSGSASASESAGTSQWDRLKSGVGGGGFGSGSGSGSTSAASPHSNSQHSVPCPSGSSRLSPSKGKKRKSDEAGVYSMDENSSASESDHVSKRRKAPTAAESLSKSSKHSNTLTRSSRATATTAAKTLASPSTMKIKPSGVIVTRSPGGRTSGTAAHILRAHHHHTTSNSTTQHNAAAQAQLRAEQSLRTAAANARQGYQAQQVQQVQQQVRQGQQVQQQSEDLPQLQTESSSGSGMYHTAANFQPFTSDNDEDDGEEDVASVASAVSEEEEDDDDSDGNSDGDGEGEGGVKEEDADADADAGGDEDADNGDDEVEDEEDEGQEEDVFNGFTSEDGARAASGSDALDSESADEDDKGEDGNESDREQSEDDQHPVKNLRPRRSQASTSAKFSAREEAPVAGGKVLRQRSSQRQSQSTSQSQSTARSRSLSRGRIVTRQSSTIKDRTTATGTTGTRGTERKLTRSTSNVSSSTSARKTSNPSSNPNLRSSKDTRSSATASASATASKGTSTGETRKTRGVETRGTKRSSTSMLRSQGSSSSSKRGRSRSRTRSQGQGGAEHREEGGGGGGEGSGSQRKRQKPLRYRNEEE